MTTAGSSVRSSRFTAELITPAAIVVAEATCASLLIDAVLTSSRGYHMSLSFWAVALPALAATAVSLASARLRRWRWRAPVLAAAVVVGAALTAGMISELGRSGSFWRVISQPWNVTGHAAAVTALTAWIVTALAWSRGCWAGISSPSFRQTAVSAGLGAAAFIGIIIGRGAADPSAFRTATSATGWLLFVWFPLVVVALALVHERDLEQQILRCPGAPPGAVWFSVLAVPMLVVALIAVLVAVAVGPLSSLAATGVTKVAQAIWWLMQKLADRFSHVQLGTHSVSRPTPSRLPTLHSVAPLAPRSTVRVPPFVAIIVVAAVGAVLVLVVLRHLRPLSRRRPPADTAVNEERDSVFSWRHLFDQLRGLLAGLLRRLRRSPAAGQPVTEAVVERELDEATVRRAYRSMLLAARASGQPRKPPETSGEFQRRLANGPGAAAAGELTRLTSLYEAARYGELAFDGPAVARAYGYAEAVSAAVNDADDATIRPDKATSA